MTRPPFPQMPAPAEDAPSEDTVADDPTSGGPPRRPRWPWMLGAVLVAGALAASWFALPIRTVTVVGERHLTAAQVRGLAGLTPGFGWLYYGAWRADGLKGSPWVRSATITRTFPDRVTVELRERTPQVRWQRSGRPEVGVAADGTLLPGARNLDGLPLVQGWGPDRLPEALRVLKVLGRYNVQSVVYTPTGLRVKLPTGSVWSGDPATLLKYAGSITMYPKQDISIYPWGVSVQE